MSLGRGDFLESSVPGLSTEPATPAVTTGPDRGGPLFTFLVTWALSGAEVCRIGIDVTDATDTIFNTFWLAEQVSVATGLHLLTLRFLAAEDGLDVMRVDDNEELRPVRIQPNRPVRIHPHDVLYSPHMMKTVFQGRNVAKLTMMSLLSVSMPALDNRMPRPTLGEELMSADAEVRQRAVMNLGWYASRGDQQVVRALIQRAVEDEDDRVQEAAVDALMVNQVVKETGNVNQEVFATLLERLDGASGVGVRMAAVYSHLYWIACRDPDLLTIVSDRISQRLVDDREGWNLRHSFVEVLGNSSAPTANVVAAIAHLLADCLWGHVQRRIQEAVDIANSAVDHKIEDWGTRSLGSLVVSRKLTYSPTSASSQARTEAFKAAADALAKIVERDAGAAGGPPGGVVVQVGEMLVNVFRGVADAVFGSMVLFTEGRLGGLEFIRAREQISAAILEYRRGVEDHWASCLDYVHREERLSAISDPLKYGNSFVRQAIENGLEKMYSSIWDAESGKRFI